MEFIYDMGLDTFDCGDNSDTDCVDLRDYLFGDMKGQIIRLLIFAVLFGACLLLSFYVLPLP